MDFQGRETSGVWRLLRPVDRLDPEESQREPVMYSGHLQESRVGNEENGGDGREGTHTLILGRAADVAGEKSSSTPALFLSDTDLSPHLQLRFSLAVLQGCLLLMLCVPSAHTV